MGSEELKAILKSLAERKGRLVGIFLGFVGGLIVVFKDVWHAAIFLFCVALGYFIGLRSDHKDSWREIIEKVLPPTE